MFPIVFQTLQKRAMNALLVKEARQGHQIRSRMPLIAGVLKRDLEVARTAHFPGRNPQGHNPASCGVTAESYPIPVGHK